MRRTFLVIDDALEPHRAGSLRSAMDSATFSDVVVQNVTYPGVCKDELPEAKQLLADSLGLLPEHIDIERQFWKLSLAGEDPDFRVHADNVFSDNVALLYFSRDEHAKGGTAFWQHSSGLWEHPSKQTLVAAGHNPEDFDVWMQDQCFLPEQWRQTDVVNFRFNRLLINPTRAYHSRTPFEGWGRDAKDGRLVWTAFFNVKP